MKKRLKRWEKEEILRIVSEENALEGTRYGFPADGDRFLAVPSPEAPETLMAFAALFDLGETRGGLPVTECMLFTDQKYRRNHVGTALLQKLRTPETVLKFAAYASPSGDAFLKAAGAGHVYDELCMTLSLSSLSEKSLKRADEMPKDTETAADSEDVMEEANEEDSGITRRFFTKHSELYVNCFGDTAYLFGVRTDRSHMRKGHAKRLLSAVLRNLSEEGTKQVLLQVSGENIPALSLYETLGFTVSERLCMWYL